MLISSLVINMASLSADAAPDMEMEDGTGKDEVDSFKGVKRNVNDEREFWNVFGYALPKTQVVFFAQISAIFLLMITSIVNLSLEKGEAKVWITFLSGSISSLLPAPVLRMEKIRNRV